MATTASEVTPGVFVGGWSDATSFPGTKICVREEVPEGIPKVTHVPIYDEVRKEPIRENLDRVADLIDKARANDQPVLVYCGHGIRRGPLAAAWYLHRYEGLTLDEAFARIAAVRPGIEPVAKWARHWQTLDDPDTGSD